jgi:hypothetical protein
MGAGSTHASGYTREQECIVRTKLIGILAAAALAWIGFQTAGNASAAGEPTCAGLGGIQVHGQHIIGDYVTGLGGIGGGLEWPPKGQVGEAIQENGGGVQVRGGPGPGFHFKEGFAPGASFCNEQAHPNGFEAPDHFAP